MNVNTNIRLIFCFLTLISIMFFIYFKPAYLQNANTIQTIINSIKSNNEWIVLPLSKDLSNANDTIFFRLNSAIYFHDQKCVKIFFICKEEIYFKLLENKIYKFRLKAQVSFSTKSNNRAETREYFASTSDYTFGIFLAYFGMVSAQLISQINIDSEKTAIKEFKMSISLISEVKTRDYLRETKTNSIMVKVKQNTLTNSNQISICLEPSFNDEKTFLDIKWFVHLNLLHIGFDRIVFANNSISNTQDYNELFEKFNDKIEIVPFNYLPNLFMPQLNKVFANDMRELSFGFEITGATSFYQVYNEFSIHECLLNNRDKNYLIFFPSTDELFLPTKLKMFDYPQRTFEFVFQGKSLGNELQVNAFEQEYLSSEKCEKRESFIKSYLESIYTKYAVAKNSSLYFPQVFFLRDHLMEEIFSKLEAAITNLSSYPIHVKIYQKHEKNISKYDANFIIIISNQFEMNYANNLLNLYKHLIKPYLEKYKKEFAKHSERLTRLFYMTLKGDTDKDVSIFKGKSFVNPNTSDRMAGPHVPNHYDGYLYGTDRKYLYNLPPYQNKEIASYYIAHFRDVHVMGQTSKLITRFNLDLNYFACFVKPIIESE